MRSAETEGLTLAEKPLPSTRLESELLAAPARKKYIHHPHHLRPQAILLLSSHETTGEALSSPPCSRSEETSFSLRMAEVNWRPATLLPHLSLMKASLSIVDDTFPSLFWRCHPTARTPLELRLKKGENPARPKRVASKQGASGSGTAGKKRAVPDTRTRSGTTVSARELVCQGHEMGSVKAVIPLRTEESRFCRRDG